MTRFKSFLGILAVLVTVCTLGGAAYSEPQQKQQKFTVAWSIYVGWMPWPYAQDAGILKKWADKYGIAIELKQMDYAPSLDAYVAKQVDACLMTNMEMLDMPAKAGVDSTAIILGDFSNGNDAICTVGLPTVKDLKGQKIPLVEATVSQYLLARALEKNGMAENDVSILNTSDSDIAAAFLTNSAKKKAVVTWNPMVMQVAQAPGAKKIFTSADIPGEILDLMVVRTDVLKNHPELGKALTGAWYEVMDLMSRRGPDSDKALEAMAKLSQCTLTEFKAQLETTAMFYTPKAAVEYTNGAEVKKSMEFVRQFCFKHGLLGDNAKSVDVVGILYPDGTIQGDKNKTRMRVSSSFMTLAAEGGLSR